MNEKGIRVTIGSGEKKRKTRSDKKHPVLPKLDYDTHKKLKRLALACDITKTSLAGEIIELAVNHPDLINYFQSKYEADEFRIVPICHTNGYVEY
ncbi:hypothetical protein ERICIV_04646 (plasmid) [Paenibacillus larvae subsp. larvae]|uniref:Uncharacterized protein n=1 Tax=Paenibacillus larvae subsp. larvae TaxID=147375 RepID=A0A2L1UKF2_9BACL|nr:hypothetical protein [Paenibacillus larvae]AQT87062.1 hypothetical protein B1222_23840 [Paenibacillus larvae subsp. pulvifaciens]AQZ49379.1 hypothetical protein B5S25_23030 [Paenibacillus larvae subsp. pulvifaciens]AVF29025.1 hypothetical protein ERICIII_05026 [Paenibacillus larvae subsp. larvae]AVF33407.1 hypothetical protein ERICIV_04646 [Paenibacillus larvae subsp. larvae]MBH0342410.1 hypothetical protein [Paenibacillus larvae]